MIKFLAVSLAIVASASAFLVDLPVLGTIKGRTTKTLKGRPYYHFRDIPFAESTAGANRFKV